MRVKTLLRILSITDVDIVCNDHLGQKRGASVIAMLVRRLARFYTAKWSSSDLGIKSRPYTSYAEYVDHQASKLSAKPNRAQHYDAELEEQLARRVEDLDLRGARVLCLGARLGGEVRAFRRRSVFAWGVDLNPGDQNPYVAFGDFQRLELPDGACDVVYTNSLDHAFDLRAVLTEARRVLRQEGILILELMDFASEPPAHWESTYWESAEDVIEVAEDCGLVAIKREPFDWSSPR